MFARLLWALDTVGMLEMGWEGLVLTQHPLISSLLAEPVGVEHWL